MDAPPPQADEAPSGADTPPGATAAEEAGAPGVREAVGSTQAAFMRMIDAHIKLLRAELSIAGQELGIIVGLALAALALALLVGILLYVGTFLFLGDWLFGSMGWGIIHGTLFTGAAIGAIGINLAGGDVRRYGLGALIGVVVTALIGVLLLSNVGNEAAEWGSRLIDENADTSRLPFGVEWTVTLVGLAVGAIIGGVVALIGSWRTQFARPLAALMIGLASGGFIGAIYASTRYDAVDGVLGLAITLGLLAWIIGGALLAARAGFDTEARYARLVPRESIAAFEQTKDFLLEQWRKQKNRMMGR